MHAQQQVLVISIALFLLTTTKAKDNVSDNQSMTLGAISSYEAMVLADPVLTINR
jgi:hypothetical protein